MEDKIEVNEYVRTKDGHIAKYIEKLQKDEDIEDGMLFDNFIYEKHKHIRYCFLKEIMVKHSKQLINLIEVGDFVNGEEVIEVRKINEKIYLMTDYCPQNYIKTDIQIILTKEQFEANCYKVGGEKE